MRVTRCGRWCTPWHTILLQHFVQRPGPCAGEALSSLCGTAFREVETRHRGSRLIAYSSSESGFARCHPYTAVAQQLQFVVRCSTGCRQAALSSLHTSVRYGEQSGQKCHTDALAAWHEGKTNDCQTPVWTCPASQSLSPAPEAVQHQPTKCWSCMQVNHAHSWSCPRCHAPTGQSSAAHMRLESSSAI